MGILSWLKSKKPKELSLENLRREEIRLTVKENQALSKLEKLEKGKEDIFTMGMKIKSPARRRQLARLYEAKSKSIGLLERELSIVSKELTALSAIRIATERKQIRKEGFARLLEKANLEELARLLEDDSVTTEMYMEKLNSMLSIATEDAEAIIQEVGSEGAEVLKVWEKLDEGEIASVEDAMRKAEDAIKKKQRELE